MNIESASQEWRGIGRKIVVGVLGSPALAELAQDAGVDVSLYETEASFRVSEPAFTAEVFDALVIDEAPWPDVDGVALARELRRRGIGTVVVGRASSRYLLEERLAVLPRSATTEVQQVDLHAALAVAAQETWALAPMRDPWGEGDPSEETTADHDVRRARAGGRGPPPVPSVTPSQIRVDAAGHASRSTMIQLFEDEALHAPALPRPAAAAVAESGPTWASSKTREWDPSQSMLIEVSQGAFDSERPIAAGRMSPSVAAGRMSPSAMPLPGAHPTLESPIVESVDSDQLVASRAVPTASSRVWLWSALGLTVVALTLLGVLLWVRG